MVTISRWAVILAVVLLPPIATADEPGESAAEVRRGKHWYQAPEPKWETKEEAAEREQHAQPSVPSMEDLMEWHPGDIRALFVEVHEFHVMKPTLSTARDVQKIKAVMTKKSRAAAAVEQLAILGNPSNSGVAENPITPSARSSKRQERDQSISQRLFDSRNDFAMVVLTQPGCGACTIQRNLLANFQDTYGWPVKEVDIVQNPQAAARFGADGGVTPITLVAARETGSWQPISIGADTLPGITRNAFQAVRLLGGEITPEQWLTDPTQQNSLYDPQYR